MSPAVINNEASKLQSQPKVAARIQELRDEVTSGVIASRLWDIERGMTEVEKNIAMARERGQMSAAAGSTRDALKLSGLLSDKPPEPDAVRITKVTVVLNHREKDPEEHMRAR